MAEQEQDRSEAATPFKLRHAKQRGSVAKSLEVNAVFVLTAFLACLLLWVPAAARLQLRLDARLIEQAAALGFGASQVHAWLSAAMLGSLAVLLPLFAAVMLAGALSSLVQHGPVFSVHPVKPDFSRINPAAGFKRLFSRRALFELGKNMLKLALFTWVLWLTLRHELPALVSLLVTDARAYDARLLDETVALLFRLLLAMVGVALLDLLFVRWEYADKMRMSRRELKDEVKQREGDPLIKARIRELQSELRKKSRALKNLPGADVLVTNPTHLAVALKYEHGRMAAPQVVAKGAGDIVDRMKQVARRHGVTIVENRLLARQLHELDIDQAVPESCYAEVARILVWIQEARRRSAPAAAPGAAGAH
jgi:flagellar biosynthesis protein FlhB